MIDDIKVSYTCPPLSAAERCRGCPGTPTSSYFNCATALSVKYKEENY